MISVASLEGSERPRLFFGLPIPPEPAEVLASWALRELGGHEGIRLVPVEHLHVTLAFLGHRPLGELPSLRQVLREAARGQTRPVFTPVRYRETDRVAMLVLEDRERCATLLQGRLVERLERLGAYRPEARPWLAHVTVARLRGRLRSTPTLPGVPAISPSEAALYHSTLRPSGAHYDIVDAVPLDDRSGR